MTGPQFRAVRERAGLSQAQAGRVLGVAAQSVYRWERGVRRIPSDAADEIRRLARKSSKEPS